MRPVTIIVAGALFAAAGSGVPAAAAPAPPAADSPAPTPQAQGAQSQESPSELVQQTAQGILKDLEANRAAYKQDPSKIAALVDKYLLPHFDTEYSAKLVLAQNWRTATPDQRKRFIDAFYHSLITNYGAYLADFTADRLKVFPSTVEPGADHATVRTEVRRDNGDRIAVNYSLHMTPQGWKAYDVNIDGISYVKSYRDDFGSQIQQQGLDSVISRLERGEKPGDIAKTASGKKS
ncbi:MAG TPA: ABC transporter substrate-binding protein [Steroidobacteraceae bacterium]|nr:ABC transporter substrate-binding protein [Steroidobacteraceae bacterium]